MVDPLLPVILTIEDESTIRDSFRSSLKDLDYRAIEASAGVSVLEVFRRNRPDLVLTDMTMPKLTGNKLTQAIHRIRPDAPVIVCAGHHEVMEAAMLSRSGFAADLMKPLIKDALLQTVGSALDEAGQGILR